MPVKSAYSVNIDNPKLNTPKVLNSHIIFPNGYCFNTIQSSFSTNSSVGFYLIFTAFIKNLIIIP